MEETRVRLRRRLLRIDDHYDDKTTDASIDSLPQSILKVNLSTGKLEFNPEYQETRSNSHSPQEQLEKEEDNDDDSEARNGEGEEEEGGEDDGDEEGEEVDEEDDDDNDGDTSTKPKAFRVEKCETSSTIKLLYSRQDPARHPVVCFEYPPNFDLVRRYSSDARVCVVNTRDCPLYYRTYWERNCVKNAFAVAGLQRTTKKKTCHWHVAWEKHMPRTKFKHLKDLQVFNHFPDPWIIGRKDRLMKTLTQCRRKYGTKEYGFFPPGFVLPDQYDSFKRSLERDMGEMMYILKPHASACGRGIKVITKKEADQLPMAKKCVIQKYLSNPLLLDGFKFDLRLYVLVTCVDPLKIYFFEQGLARFCTSPYDLTNLTNRFSHLTNYSINKQNQESYVYGSLEEEEEDNEEKRSSKWSLSVLLDFLHANHQQNPEKIKNSMKEIMIKTIIASETHLNSMMAQYVSKKTKNNCFELFGFDMMLDDQYQPWLIEVNVSPSLMGGSPLDKRIKGLLLSDIFHLVGVQVPVSNTTTTSSTINTISTSKKSGSSSTGSTNKALYDVVMDPKVTHFENNHIEMFTSNEWDVIHLLEDENDRLGHFERIFPTSNATEMAKYASFFPIQRYNNALCAKWLHSKGKRRVTKAKSQQSLLVQQPSQQPSRKILSGRKYRTTTTTRTTGTRTTGTPPQGIGAALLMPSQALHSAPVIPPKTLTNSNSTPPPIRPLDRTRR